MAKTLLSRSVELVRIAEEAAKGLSQQHEKLLAEEALLRAAIAWVHYAQKAHWAAIEDARESAKDEPFVEITRRRLVRAENHLQLRLIASIARKCEGLREAQARKRAASSNDERLLKTADLALALLQ